MKGITPVIAIILLLLMAVAAAGGFYFVYQGFTESGEESGSTQIESLGEQSLAQIQIESAAGGRIYVKNVGAGDVDLSKATVYVESQPVSVNRSSDTLAERSRAVLKLTERPGCTAESCEVKISGAASTSKTVDLAKLLCSSDAECYSSETCEGGVCVEEEVVETTCGDGNCEEGEHGYDCFEDCHPESLIVLPATHFATYDWNGTTYDFVSNFTPWVKPYQSSYLSATFLANGNHLFSGSFNNGPIGSQWYSKYDGSSWSYPYNLSGNYKLSPQPWPVKSSDVDSSGNAMFVWRYVESSIWMDKIQYASLVNGVVSSPENATGWLHPTPSEGLNEASPAFEFLPDDTGFLVYANRTEFDVGNYQHKILYRQWDGTSFSAPTLLYNRANNADLQAFNPPLVSFAENGDGVAVWMTGNETNHAFPKYATYDGSWTYQGNFEGWTPLNETNGLIFSGLEHDHGGDAVAVLSDLSGVGSYHALYEDGAWGGRQSLPDSEQAFVPQLYKTSDDTLLAIDGDVTEELWRWMSWNGNGWSDPVHMGPADWE